MSSLLTQAGDKPRARLSPADNSAALKPWRKAAGLEEYHAYWLPSEFPMRTEQRQWVSSFSAILAERAKLQWGLSPQMFLEMRAILPELANSFSRISKDFVPLLGLGRRPSVALAKPPTEEYLERLQTGKAKFKFGDHIPDYCYWLATQQQHFELLAGFGGLTTAFTKSNDGPLASKSFIPSAAKRDPVLGQLAAVNAHARTREVAWATKQPFLKRSKELFGRGLETLPQFPGLFFVLPLIEPNDCFTQPVEIKECLSVFELYVRESVADRGVLLISSYDCDQLLAEVAKEIKI